MGHRLVGDERLRDRYRLHGADHCAILGRLQRDIGCGLVAARARDVLHDDRRIAGNESSEMTPDETCVGVESPADRRAHDDGDDLTPVESFNRILRRGRVRREARGREGKGT
jgi:hypothetical protein